MRSMRSRTQRPRSRRPAARRTSSCCRSTARHATSRRRDFEPRDHVELGRILGAIDVERGAKVSGSRFYYLTGAGADLEFALVNMALDQARCRRFHRGRSHPPWSSRARWRAPASSARPPTTSTASRARTPISWAPPRCPLAAYHSDEILDAESLPRRYVAFSPCFRKEAGSHGKDTRGIIRVHWFDKVEMFTYTTIEESSGRARAAARVGARVPRQARAGLPRHRRRRRRSRPVGTAQVRLRGVGADPGALPRADLDVELHRLPGTAPRHPWPLRQRGRPPIATLNGTLCAVPRTIVAILETHQQADGSVRVPAALQPYLQGREVLEPIWLTLRRSSPTEPTGAHG